MNLHAPNYQSNTPGPLTQQPILPTHHSWCSCEYIGSAHPFKSVQDVEKFWHDYLCNDDLISVFFLTRIVDPLHVFVVPHFTEYVRGQPC